MFFFLLSSLSFFIILSKSLPLQPLPPWASETRLLSLFFWRDLLCFVSHALKNWRATSARMHGFCHKMSSPKKTAALKVGNGEDAWGTSVLDLPELALEIILGKLSPAGLCNMAGVCSKMRVRCRSDHLWERHMREKWGQLIGPAAHREWEVFLASGKHSSSSVAGKEKPKGWTELPSCVWPLFWFESRINSGCTGRNYVPGDSIMSRYLALEGGKFSFPAQVYNREHGHIGFMLSCYDAELSYDSHTDTFQARYPPHGRRTTVIEEGVDWDRLRAPPIDISAHELLASDCLNELHPGDHIEIQWRRNKEFPYGWWYGVVGHLEECDGNEYRCRCCSSDIVILEFNQYTPGSRWRRSAINRKNHREEGNESDGFYGGIRKLQNQEEIAIWKRLWPTDVLE